MIAHAHHVHDIALNIMHDPIFMINNRAVWNILADLGHDHKCWMYLKPFQQHHNGRAAFLALHDHYLRSNNVDSMASIVEDKINGAAYFGEKKYWIFESYVLLQKGQH